MKTYYSLLNMRLSKLQKTILYLLKYSQDCGYSNLSMFQIFKLVYLLEVEHRRYIGTPFLFDINFKREKNGPISTDIYNAVESLTGKFINTKETQTEGYPFARKCHSLSKADLNGVLDFTTEELFFINSVLNDFLNIPQKKLQSIVYSTEPMVNIQQEEKQKGRELLGQQLDLDTVLLDNDILERISYGG